MTSIRNDTVPDRDEQAAMWYLRLLDGELPFQERDEFDRWIVNRENAVAYEDAARVWLAVDGASDTPELIHMRSDALESYRRVNRRRWTRALPVQRYWAGAVAAAVLIVILSSALLFHPAQVYETGIGERRVVILGDGSRLSLDADTEVDVRLRRDRRELTLMHGRAKFDVAHDPLRPFTVSVGDKMVVATGTSFSVEVLDQKVHVLLYEGHVAVLDKGNDQPVPGRVVSNARANAANIGAADIALTPGKELVVALASATPATVSATDIARSSSWEAGQLIFDDEPLESAVARMNRYSTDKLEVGDAAAADVRVTGVFTAGDTNALVEGVIGLNAIHADRHSGKVILRSN